MKKEDLRELYAPKFYPYYLAHEERCYIGGAQTIGEACKKYNFDEVCEVVSTCVIELLEYNGSRMKDGHITNLVQAIVSGFPHLKLSELMLFFAKHRTGEYGKMFQVIYPGDVVVPLKSFANEAMQKRGELLSALQYKRIEDARTKMSQDRVSAAAAAQWWGEHQSLVERLKAKKSNLISMK